MNCPKELSLENPLENELAGYPLTNATELYIRNFAAGTTHTSRAKRLDISHFLQFLRAYHGIAEVANLTLSHWTKSAVDHFIDDILRSGGAPATAARRLATIKHMGRTFADKIPGFINPAREVKPPKVGQLRPKSLNSREIAAVRTNARERTQAKNSFIRQRNFLLFEFLLDTGIRADEVRNLRLSQLDENCEWIRNVRTKGKRYRTVYITSAIRPLLKEYLELRKSELKKFYPTLAPTTDKALPVFISTFRAEVGKPESFEMGAKTVWRAIREISNEVKLHPHILRHSYATELLDTTNDIRLVAQALGHSDVRITMRYTEREAEDVARALEDTRRKRSKS